MHQLICNADLNQTADVESTSAKGKHQMMYTNVEICAVMLTINFHLIRCTM